ncbi:MAG: AbiEi antitoxin N-terminal domain-containing protein [Alphaproteobacteria bacterium]|nr:AbiEi antitoxin N-terminal domain-containing protein [Alphaproteobacteria bacterium]
MPGQKSAKLKCLLQTVPPGFLVDTTWTARHAISRQSVAGYLKQGWLERLSPASIVALSPSARDWNLPPVGRSHCSRRSGSWNTAFISVA